MEVTHRVDCAVWVPGSQQLAYNSLGAAPVVAQRLNDGGQYQPFNIGTRSVVRTKRATLRLVQGSFQ